MVNPASLLRQLPSVGEVLAHPRLAGLAEAGPHGLARLAAKVGTSLGLVRAAVRDTPRAEEDRP